ncbi:RWDD1 [Scenedesmus sp. PABB004]|nr:RWDD1 [Scenedesmus sp. PABB004]
MTDHAGEQEMELEALEAIFPDDLEEFDGNLPDGWSRHGKTWAVTIRPPAEEGGGDEPDDHELQMQLVFAHTPTYPDEPPCLRLRSLQGLSDAELAEATAELEALAAESLGMAMIYTLVTAAQEWLGARIAAGPGGAGGGADPEAEEKRRREEEEAARAAARAHGHPVTVEAFEEWRRKFEAEQAAARGADGKGGAADGARVTGKQWFLAQLAAGKVVSSSEEEDGEESEGEEEAFAGAGAEEDDEDEDLDYDDDDDEELLEELGANPPPRLLNREPRIAAARPLLQHSHRVPPRCCAHERGARPSAPAAAPAPARASDSSSGGGSAAPPRRGAAPRPPPPPVVVPLPRRKPVAPLTKQPGAFVEYVPRGTYVKPTLRPRLPCSKKNVCSADAQAAADLAAINARAARARERAGQACHHHHKADVDAPRAVAQREHIYPDRGRGRPESRAARNPITGEGLDGGGGRPARPGSAPAAELRAARGSPAAALQRRPGTARSAQGRYNPLTHAWLEAPDADAQAARQRASDRAHGFIGLRRLPSRAAGAARAQVLVLEDGSAAAGDDAGSGAPAPDAGARAAPRGSGKGGGGGGGGGAYDCLRHVWLSPPPAGAAAAEREAAPGGLRFDQPPGATSHTRKVRTPASQGVYDPILGEWRVPPADRRAREGLQWAPRRLFDDKSFR